MPTPTSARPRTTTSSGASAPLEGIVCQHLTIARVAEALDVASDQDPLTFGEDRVIGGVAMPAASTVSQ
jgi:hypothetical protein